VGCLIVRTFDSPKVRQSKIRKSLIMPGLCLGLGLLIGLGLARTARTHNNNVGSHSSQYSETFMRQNSCKTRQKVLSSVFCGKLVVTAMNVLSPANCSKQFAGAAGKARSPMVARTVRGTTSADVDDERSRRCAPRSESETR